MKKFSEFLINRDNDIWKYIQYISNKENISIQEAAKRSLSRVYNLVSTSRKPVAILTAFRGERPIGVNKALNKELEQDMRLLGWGFIPVLGGTTEKVKNLTTGEETGEIKKIDGEESYFVTGNNESTFENDILNLLKKYNQEGAIIKHSGDNAYLFTATGEKHLLGKWSQDKLAQYWTKLKYGPKERQFSFESFDFIAAGDSSRITRMIINKLFD